MKYWNNCKISSHDSSDDYDVIKINNHIREEVISVTRVKIDVNYTFLS